MARARRVYECAPLHWPDGVPHRSRQRLRLRLARCAQRAVRLARRVAGGAELLDDGVGQDGRRAQHARHHVACGPGRGSSLLFLKALSGGMVE